MKQWFQQRRHGWLTDPSQTERGHGYTQLASGEISLEVFLDGCSHARWATASIGKPLDTKMVRFHQSKLGCHKKGVQSQQYGYYYNTCHSVPLPGSKAANRKRADF
jgi:hypothetical protein